MPPEIISKFKEKPKTKTAWRAMWLGLATFLVPPFLGIFAAIIRPLIDRVSSESVGIAAGFGAAIFSLSLSIYAFVTGIRAFKKGERSWVLWIGFVPAILNVVFWVFMIIGELVFPH